MNAERIGEIAARMRELATLNLRHEGPRNLDAGNELIAWADEITAVLADGGPSTVEGERPGLCATPERPALSALERGITQTKEEVMQGAAAEMPRYKCFKEVHALKITGFSGTSEPETTSLNVEGPFKPIPVSDEWIKKHTPEVGGYYVVYKDGYTSYSPAAAFEEGYERV